MLVTCDHASRAVPRCLGKLGLGDRELALHIGWDIGAGAVTRDLSRLLDAPGDPHGLLAPGDRLQPGSRGSHLDPGGERRRRGAGEPGSERGRAPAPRRDAVPALSRRDRAGDRRLHRPRRPSRRALDPQLHAGDGGGEAALAHRRALEQGSADPRAADGGAPARAWSGGRRQRALFRPRARRLYRAHPRGEPRACRTWRWRSARI